jgi:hypothetical protein
MFRNGIFVAKEGIRNIFFNYISSLHFLLFGIIILLLIGIELIIIINANYLIEIFSSRTMSNLLFKSLLPYIDKINSLGVFLYFPLPLILIILFILNRIYQLHYLNNYRDEIELMKRISGNIRIIKMPVLYTSLIINISASLLAWLIICLSYNYIYDLLITNFIKVSLLRFQDFRFTLLFFQLFIASGVSIFETYLLFWNKYNF